jgi:nucleoside-diphosphate-sugar epimerase
MQLFGSIPENDLEELSKLSLPIIKELESVNFVIVGASGFLGRWLSTYIVFMAECGLFKGTLTMIVRDLEAMKDLERIVNIGTSIIVKESYLGLQDEVYAKDERTIVFFAASSTLMYGTPKKMAFESSIDLGTRVIGKVPKSNLTFIHLSSGGIYDPKARELPGIPSNFAIQQTSMDAYINEKILIENWSTKVAKSMNFTVRNPRLFSFYGPGLQFDRGFAIAEFLNLARKGEAITVRGRPENLRTYLYPTDAIFQLLLQCSVEEPKFLQIGSAVPRTILNVAETIAAYFGVEVHVQKTYLDKIDNYVPLEVPIMREKDMILGISQWDRWLEKLDRN